MAVFIECDSPQTLYAVTRQAKTSPQYCFVRGCDEGAAIAARMLVRLIAARFAVSDLGHGRVLVTPGDVDVEALWRRARRGTRDVAVRDFRRHELWTASRMVEVARQEDERRRAVGLRREAEERATEDAALADLVL